MNSVTEASVTKFTTKVGNLAFRNTSTTLTSAYEVNMEAVNVYNAAATDVVTADVRAAAAAAKLARNFSVVAASAATIAANSIDGFVSNSIATDDLVLNTINAMLAAAKATVEAANNTLVAIVNVIDIANTIDSSSPLANKANVAHVAALNAHTAAINVYTNVINLHTAATHHRLGRADTITIFHFAWATLKAIKPVLIAIARIVAIDNATLDASTVDAINATVVAANATDAAFMRTSQVIIEASTVLAVCPSTVGLTLYMIEKFKNNHPIKFMPYAK